MTDIVLVAGRDRSVRRRHPWVLSGSVARVDGEPESGAWVRVVSAQGEPLGYGHWSSQSQIRVRLLSFGKEDPGPEILDERIARAVARRESDPALRDTDAIRLVNSEGDGLPGLVVDRYADVVVVRISTAGMDARREAIASAVRRVTGASTGLARPDAAAARREGIAAQPELLFGEPLDGTVAIDERGRGYEVDALAGQKTGFYLDQRTARDRVQSNAEGRRVLDLFAYTGGFSVAAAKGGARSVSLVESSADALALAERNLAAVEGSRRIRVERSDAFRFIRRDGGTYGLIVVDPPPLARRVAEVGRASRAYKDVLLFALKRAEPDALVLAFSCSHHVGPDLFRKIVFGASVDAERPLQVLEELSAPSDHPVSLDHPEGRYLSGLLLRA